MGRGAKVSCPGTRWGRWRSRRGLQSPELEPSRPEPETVRAPCFREPLVRERLRSWTQQERSKNVSPALPGSETVIYRERDVRRRGKQRMSRVWCIFLLLVDLEG